MRRWAPFGTRRRRTTAGPLGRPGFRSGSCSPRKNGGSARRRTRAASIDARFADARERGTHGRRATAVRLASEVKPERDRAAQCDAERGAVVFQIVVHEPVLRTEVDPGAMKPDELAAEPTPHGEVRGHEAIGA